MTDIILCGCTGKMGRAVTACVQERQDCRIVAGIDIQCDPACSFPIFHTPRELPSGTRADVIIDFSSPAALPGLLEYAALHATALVIATTGHDQAQIALIHRAATRIPLFFSANMSLGVSLLAELAAKAAKVLGASYDIEIIEKHHNQKVDAPSGTALMLANAISSELTEPAQYVYDRHDRREKRGKQEIGLHAMRGGTITGEHEILFAGHDEILTLSHSARSKEVFASGALNAALFLLDKPAGLYQMADLVK